jgi:hypothetical protein
MAETVKESQDCSLEALKSASAPEARSVVTELEEADALDEGLTPGGETVSEELIVQVVPQGADEFTCSSCSPQLYIRPLSARQCLTAFRSDGLPRLTLHR